MTERRKHCRRRTLLEGRIEIAKLNGWALDCTVRNLSEGGARIALPGNVIVPQRVGLSVSHGLSRPAELVWYRGGHAGFALGEERRSAARPVPANDVRSPRVGPLSARIAAIAAKGPATLRFTGL